MKSPRPEPVVPSLTAELAPLPPCPAGRRHEREIDAHFALASSPERERELREHLRSCGPCRARYERHLLLAKLDPAAPSFERRMGRALGLPASAARNPRWWAQLSVAVIATAATAFLMLPARTPGGDAGMRARGAAPAAPSLAVYRVARGGAPTLVDDVINADDELAFAYANPAGLARLFVFGRDEHGHVYWYHPAWTDPASDPQGVPAAKTSGAAVEELPQAVKHPLDGRDLTLYAVFVDDVGATVRGFERLLAAATPAEANPFAPHATIIRHVRVEPPTGDPPP